MNPRLRPWQGRTLPLSYSRSVKFYFFYFMGLVLSRKDSCWRQELFLKDRTFIIKLNQNRVDEYLNLIQGNQIDIEKQIWDKNGMADFYNLPF